MPHEHPGPDIKEELLHPLKKHEVLQVQNRGEYLYAACGEAGIRVYDIAFIDDKAFSERHHDRAGFAAGAEVLCAHPTRRRRGPPPARRAPDRHGRILPRQGTEINGLFGFLYVADKYEGLILVGAAPAIDGNPLNNFLKREKRPSIPTASCAARPT